MAALDEVAPDVPVVLVSGDAHHGWLNTRALDLLGMARRDDVLLESEWYAAYARIREIAGDETSPEAYLRMEAAAAALGVVGVVELEYGEGAGRLARSMGAGRRPAAGTPRRLPRRARRGRRGRAAHR